MDFMRQAVVTLSDKISKIEDKIDKVEHILKNQN